VPGSVRCRRKRTVKGTTCALRVYVSVLLVGCGSDAAEPSAEPSDTSTAVSSSAPTTETTENAPALVGRWERTHKCPELIKAFEQAGLGEVAPQFVTEYFPNEHPKDLAPKLARKDDPCEGAKPFVHSHFFSETGAFGSLTGELQQVDEGVYEIIDDSTFIITNANVTFHYRIEGDQLMLTPVLTRAMKGKALEHPLNFSPAGMAIAVSYPGNAWKRVDCAGWC
jgi:hypothetical protein